MSPACWSSSRRSPQPSATSRRRPRLDGGAHRPSRSPLAREHRACARRGRRCRPRRHDGLRRRDPGCGQARSGSPRCPAPGRDDAADDGVEFVVDSGWRSPAYQEQLLREAVSKYGSEAEAARWVATPNTSAHVSGDAVDIGPSGAAAWLSEHGAAYGLCQIYGNEPWHYELRPEAVDHGCPRHVRRPDARSKDATHEENTAAAGRPCAGRPDRRGLWLERILAEHRQQHRHRRARSPPLRTRR